MRSQMPTSALWRGLSASSLWARFCVSEGTWQDPPTLGVLRDRLVAVGGGLGAVTADVVIPELRNGEAHETLVWDGFAEQFSTEGVQIAPENVVASAQLAQCFIAGCEAGLNGLFGSSICRAMRRACRVMTRWAECQRGGESRRSSAPIVCSLD